MPTGVSNSTIASLLAELEKVQDKVISMALGVFGGKKEFVDWQPELDAFARKVKKDTAETKGDSARGALISAKVLLLMNVVGFTHKTSLALVV